MDISQVLGSTPTPQKGSTPNQPTNSVDGAFGQLIIKAKHSLEEHPSDQLPEGVSIPTSLDDLEAYLKEFVKNEMNPESLKKASASKVEFAELEEFVTNSELASNPLMGALTNEEIAEKISQMIQSGKIADETPTQVVATTEAVDLSIDTEMPEEIKAQVSISEIQKNLKGTEGNISTFTSKDAIEKTPEPVNFAANLTGKTNNNQSLAANEATASKLIVQDLNGGKIQPQADLVRTASDTTKQSAELPQQISSSMTTALSQAIKDTVKPQVTSESNTNTLADKIEIASQDGVKPTVTQTTSTMTQATPNTPAPVIIPTSGEGMVTQVSTNATTSFMAAPQTTTITSSMMIQNSIVATDEWKQELGANMVRMAKTGDTTATLKLNPMELGTINVDLKVSDKQVQINFASMSSQVRAAVEQALPQLRESFEDQGLELSDSSFSDESRFQQEQSTQRMVMNDSNDTRDDDELLPEETTIDETKVKNSAIDTYV